MMIRGGPGISRNEGDRNPKAKLTEEQVRQIKFHPDRDQRGFGKRMAAQYNISSAMVSQILSNKRWCHVSEEGKKRVTWIPPKDSKFYYTYKQMRA